jgi:hypothetical protein
MIQVTWKIESLDRRSEDGFVTTAHWRAIAVDGEHSASVYGTCGWGEGEVAIPFEELTPETVLEWCWSEGSGIDKDEVEASLASQIDSLKNPVSVSGTPW